MDTLMSFKMTQMLKGFAAEAAFIATTFIDINLPSIRCLRTCNKKDNNVRSDLISNILTHLAYRANAKKVWYIKQ